jgi:hypothetical protein
MVLVAADRQFQPTAMARADDMSAMAKREEMLDAHMHLLTRRLVCAVQIRIVSTK